jgi:hypothetical protein
MDCDSSCNRSRYRTVICKLSCHKVTLAIDISSCGIRSYITTNGSPPTQRSYTFVACVMSKVGRNEVASHRLLGVNTLACHPSEDRFKVKNLSRISFWLAGASTAVGGVLTVPLNNGLLKRLQFGILGDSHCSINSH